VLIASAFVHVKVLVDVQTDVYFLLGILLFIGLLHLVAAAVVS